jgi:hypothetical protein
VLSLVFSAAGSSCWRHGHLNFPNVYMNIYRSVYFTCEAVSLVPVISPLGIGYGPQDQPCSWHPLSARSSFTNPMVLL